MSYRLTSVNTGLEFWCEGINHEDRMPLEVVNVLNAVCL